MNIYEKIAFGKGINVLSLFGGIECGAVALQNLGIPINYYGSAEIDPYPSAIATANHPYIKHLGDVQNIKGSDLPQIDLMFCGSPCQDLSFAKSDGKGLDGEKSSLFYEFVRLLDEVKPTFFLFENVRMKQEYQKIIEDKLGVKLFLANSSLVSAQNRLRLYGTNIEQHGLPKDQKVVLKDILEDVPYEDIPNYLLNTWGSKKRAELVRSTEDEKARCLTATMWKGQVPSYVKTPIHLGDAENIKGFDIIKRVYSEDGKSPSLTTMQGGHREPKVAISGASIRGRHLVNGVRQDHKMSVKGLAKQQLEIRIDEKTNCLTTVQKDNVLVDIKNWLYRKLTPTECESLQTLPKDYTKWGVFRNDKKYDPTLHEHLQRKEMSKTRRFKAIGNGWTVKMIEHILGDLVIKAEEIKLKEVV